MSVPFAKNNLAVTDGILEMYNENTGNFIKQSDSTTLKYRLLDNDPNEQSQLAGLKATAFLIKKEAKSEVVAYQSDAVIDSQNVAHFKITKPLPVGSYRVEISVVVDDQTIQIFPSKSDDMDARLTITPSAVGLEVGSTPDTFDIKVVHQIIEDILAKKSLENAKSSGQGIRINIGSASSQWVLNHELGFYPNVTCVDSAGNEVVGEITYISLNKIEVNFSAPFSGCAILS